MKEVKGLEKVLKALANKRRLAILAYIKKNNEASVSDIAGSIPLSFKATSKHLAILVAADLLDREQRRLHMYYRISSTIPSPAVSILVLL